MFRDSYDRQCFIHGCRELADEPEPFGQSGRPGWLLRFEDGGCRSPVYRSSGADGCWSRGRCSKLIQVEVDGVGTGVGTMSEHINHEDVKTVSAGGVTVERRLVCTDAGIEGTFVLESRRDTPVEVRVVDELPEYFPIDEVAFSPESAPDAGNITPDRVTLTQTVEDGPVRLRYGIVPSEPVAEVRWSAPTVERVDAVESVDGDSPEASGSVGPVAELSGLFDFETDDPPDEGAPDGDTPETDPDIGDVEAGEADDGTTGADAEGATADDDGDPTEGDTDAGDPTEGETAPSELDDTGPRDEFESADPADATTRIEPSDESPEDMEEATPTGHAEASTNGASDETPVEAVDETADEEVDDLADDGSAGADGDTASAGADVVETTAEDAPETADGEAAETGDGAPIPAAEADSEETAEVARHLEVRLDRLSARVEKFGAYAAALEPFIDERGTGETALSGIEDDLADLDRRLDSVREAVESVDEDRERAVSNLKDSVGDIDGALDDVEAAVETLETEVDGLDLGLDAAEEDIDDLEEQVGAHDEAIESTADDVVDLESDLADVDENVERVDREVDEVDADVSALGDDLATLETRVDDFETDLEELTETVEGVESELATLSADVESIHDELADIHDEVETLHTFRKSLAQISNIEE